MGPRSCERGNSVGGFTAGTEYYVLQWGRAHVSAETQVQVAEYAERLHASMGPRSCERGNLSLGLAWRYRFTDFNGAALM